MGTPPENLEKKRLHNQGLTARDHWTNYPIAPEGRSPRVTRRLLTLAEVSRFLGLSPYTVRRLIWLGQLPAVRLSRKIQVDVRDVERLIERRKDRSGSS